ncbi:protein singed [Rosenbergiella australiborealis]|uniref:protein singed n=1 Tax=Rosenbergiella australiborealis TaxID=1544696 RepID=UPI001F4E5648|nr:protein singed [Rosenbergiella australiborealis]
MAQYITVNEVDTLLGSDWASDSVKPKAILMANAWLSALNLQGINLEDIPDEVKQAGAYVASVAAAGNLYTQKESSGVLASESVKADDVEVTETYYTGSTINADSLLDPDLQLALALLTPWQSNPLKFRVYR